VAAVVLGVLTVWLGHRKSCCRAVGAPAGSLAKAVLDSDGSLGRSAFTRPKSGPNFQEPLPSSVWGLDD
jgi:hypothetical protein